ncbi:serine/threonine-protein kinase Chk1-like [Oratosquilla oratoria]|uniref:serine/threonine-protein kinase Chk1-like n=1 Tax=Oratosquilla oratoria TaxID=337810 RepID=UPI003F76F7C3
MFFRILCCGRRSYYSKGAESHKTGEDAGRWISFIRGFKRLGSALRKCACQEPQEETPGSLEDAPLQHVTKKPNSKILKENKLAVRAFSTTDWNVVRLLGKGSYGFVHLLKNQKTQETVARKQAMCCFSLVQEAVIHVQLNHVNIVKAVGWTRTHCKVFLFMEYCAGGTILDAIRQKIPQEDVGRFFSQLMSAVDYLHCRGVVHRDLKPDNLLLTDKKVLKVADLGLASVFIVNGKEVQMTRLLGGGPYMAPEVFRSWKYAGPSSDLWSCGVILFNMVTQHNPWRIAHTHDPNYERWANKNEAVGQKTKWKKINKFCWRTYVEALLSPDPVERLFIWRTTLRHHLRAINETPENSPGC